MIQARLLLFLALLLGFMSATPEEISNCEMALTNEKALSVGCINELTREKDEHNQCKIRHSEAISEGQDWLEDLDQQIVLTNETQAHLEHCEKTLSHVKSLQQRSEEDPPSKKGLANTYGYPASSTASELSSAIVPEALSFREALANDSVNSFNPDSASCAVSVTG